VGTMKAATIPPGNFGSLDIDTGMVKSSRWWSHDGFWSSADGEKHRCHFLAPVPTIRYNEPEEDYRLNRTLHEAIEVARRLPREKTLRRKVRPRIQSESSELKIKAYQQQYQRRLKFFRAAARVVDHLVRPEHSTLEGSEL
jgi:hypothetical protein